MIAYSLDTFEKNIPVSVSYSSLLFLFNMEIFSSSREISSFRPSFSIRLFQAASSLAYLSESFCCLEAYFSLRASEALFQSVAIFLIFSVGLIEAGSPLLTSLQYMRYALRFLLGFLVSSRISFSSSFTDLFSLSTFFVAFTALALLSTASGTLAIFWLYTSFSSSLTSFHPWLIFFIKSEILKFGNCFL